MIDTAIQQDAPLQNILSDLAMDYERLNDLMNKRESELAGRGILIVLFVCIGLPVLIAFIVGLFAPAKSGYQIVNSTPHSLISSLLLPPLVLWSQEE